jgi:Methylase involved in ubiquinone/menaquinone biosynthesis
MGIRDYVERFRASSAAGARLFKLARSRPDVTEVLLSCVETDVDETFAHLNSLAQRQSAMVGFSQELQNFSRLLSLAGRQPLDPADTYPCLNDRTAETGFDRHYIYHPAWAARVVAAFRPEKHVDISSTLHFATILSAFVKVEFFDFRPAPLVLSNLSSEPADLTNLHFASNSISSLSCMHVLEHVGLGRYGDPMDVDGDKKACRELSRVLAKGGRLLVAMPVGRPRIQFNAHRIYSHEQVLALFEGLTLVEHALVPDGAAEEGLIPNPDGALIDAQSYGCGCYVFSK